MMKITRPKIVTRKMREATMKYLAERKYFVGTPELETWSKTRLIKHVIKLQQHTIKLMYVIYKSKLPRLRKTKPMWQKKYPLGVAGSGLEPIRRKKKRKFSAKQLAAQRLFAKRARAGTLRKRRRR